MDVRERVVVVTGATSGIGNACATLLAKKGARVYGTCRSPSSYSKKADEFFELLQMDVENDESVSKAAEHVISKESSIDVLVCCAGAASAAAVEESPLEEARRMLEVNYLGSLRVIKAFLPRMREMASGRIILTGALEGRMGAPFQAYYAASKFAVEGLAESLRLEVRDFGIEVCILTPSSFRTAFGQHRSIGSGSDASPYRRRMNAAVDVLAVDEAKGASPLIAAKAVYKALSSRRMPYRLSVGGGAQSVLAALKPFIPYSLFEHVRRSHFRLE
jgi:NAD(P)-dependent dehydrogenase (short-subunit alcohol dehydrogenase family)